MDEGERGEKESETGRKDGWKGDNVSEGRSEVGSEGEWREWKMKLLEGAVLVAVVVSAADVVEVWREGVVSGGGRAMLLDVQVAWMRGGK